MSTEQPRRAVLVARLSRETEGSTSVERQIAECREVCDSQGWEVVGEVSDTNVSAGATTPFERPALREWIGNGADDPGRVHEFDVLVFWRLDRIVRSIVHLHRLMDWADTHNVVLRSATEQHFDTSSPLNKGISSLLATFAEMELEAIRERTGADQRHRIRSGKYRGGLPPWGYRPVESPDGWLLEPDPAQKRQIHEVVERCLAGESLSAIARSFNNDGIPTPADVHRDRLGKPRKGYKWSTSRLKEMLTSDTMLGYIVTRDPVLDNNGRPRRDSKGNKILGDLTVVRNDDGSPKIRSEPLMDLQTLERVRATLREREVKRSASSRSSSLLIGVIHCGHCGRVAYRLVGSPGRKPTYRCRSAQEGTPCGAPNLTVDLEWVDDHATALVLANLGRSERLVRVWDRGNDNAAEIAESKAELENIVPQLGTKSFRFGSVSGDLLNERVAALQDRIDTLEEEGYREPGWIWEPTGETFGDWWESATVSERNKYLRTAGIRVEYTYSPDRKRGDKPSVNIIFENYPKALEGVDKSPTAQTIENILKGLSPGTVAELVNGEWTIRPKTEEESKQ